MHSALEPEPGFYIRVCVCVTHVRLAHLIIRKGRLLYLCSGMAPGRRSQQAPDSLGHPAAHMHIP